MKIVIPERIDVLPKKYLDELNKFGQVLSYKDFPTDSDEILSRIREAELLIVKWIDLPKDFLDYCVKLKAIVTLTSGYGHLPIKEARNKGIDVINCPTHNSNAVAEHVIALMFAVARKISISQVNIQKGNWKSTPYDFLGMEFKGKELGLVGHGNIGSKVGEKAKALGMKVKFVNSKSSSDEIDKLVRQSDIISLNLPLNERTKYLFDRRRLGFMKSTAILVNTSRGDLLDQRALYDLLKQNKIFGAGLDVFSGSPAKGKAPDEIVNLAKLANVVTTPHLAFNTLEAGERMGKEMIENVDAWIKGKPINLLS